MSNLDIQDVSSVVSISPAIVRQVLVGEPRRLTSAFDWSSTPQGHGYWLNRASRREELSPADRLWLLALIRRGETA